MHARYAIYFAPDPDSRLWERGCRWLGRDAERDCALVQPAVPGWTPERLRALTNVARRYGWHATLKPPFLLRHGCDATILCERLASLCERRARFDLPPLAVARLSRFLALRPTAESAALQALANACVVEFDDLRAPLEPSEAARRRAAGLSPRQEALLQRYGYPYVLDEFRFHLTLTDSLDDAVGQQLLPWLSDHFADALCQSIAVSGVCLFVQAEPGADFRLVRRFTFAR
jgi:putative phosphonate metabolism protein